MIRSLVFVLVNTLLGVSLWAQAPCEKAELCPKICDIGDSLSQESCLSLCHQLHCRGETISQPSSARNEWVLDNSEEKQDTPVLEESKDSGGFSLPVEGRVCSQSDRSACSEQCREFFDRAFTDCQSNCLAGRCKLPTDNRPGEEPEKVADLCIEFETERCQKRCFSGDETTRKGCRRSCLITACPNASQLAIAEEALDPGSATCKRCKDQHQVQCRRICRIQPGSFREFPVSSLSVLACEELCVRSRCGEKCPLF